MDNTRLAYVDVETTGSRPASDRITEVGVVLVDDHQVTDKWQTLVNPDTAIPGFIQSLTGITNDMVAHAPAFSRIADELAGLLQDRVFVAHNARFDYNFIRNEFRRAGIEFSAPVACTVKLSRQLYPQQSRHNLDTLLSVHHISCQSRHRALDDAQVLPQIVSAMIAEHGRDPVESAIEQQFRQFNLPVHIDAEQINRLPHGPGVYLFYGEKGVPLYVGKSNNIHDRVRSHFSSSNRNDRSHRIVEQLRVIDCIETAGELGALLKEADLVKQLQPLYNRRLRRNKSLLSIYWDSSDPAQPPQVVDCMQSEALSMEKLYGLFRSKRALQQRLKNLADKHQLCLKKLGQEKGKGPCFGYQVGKCRGVCAGKEPVMKHQLRMMEAFADLKLEAWPFEGPVAVREATTGRESVHIIDQWRHLQTVNLQHGEQLDMRSLDLCSRPIDVDAYKILVGYLLSPKNKVQVTLLGDVDGVTG